MFGTINKSSFFILLLLFISCSENPDKRQYILVEESTIVNKYKEELNQVNEKLKEAEQRDQLQTQLDLKRKLDDISSRMNKELKECTEHYPLGKNIPFEQPSDSAQYKILEVKLIGCRIVPNSFDIETIITAKVKIKNSIRNYFAAQFVDNTSKNISDLKFSFTNDYPEPNKTVSVITHLNNFRKIKNFSKIIFN
jgi:hypothetical protein